MADLGGFLSAAGVGGAIGQAVVQLDLDTRKYQTELAAAEGQTKASTSSMSSSLGSFKNMAGPAFAVAATAVVAFAAESIKAASDLNESTNKAQVVFGDAADSVMKFAKTSATAFGISESAALEAAASFGSMFEAANLSEDAASDMSTTMVSLAADMASFNNTDPSDMLERLRSGLAGEAEPLRKFGVFLSESAVQAKAMELGLVGAHGELTEGEKIQARYALIMEQTSKQQGDFARTSDSLANQQRIMSAELTDLSATFGKLLLPALSAVVGAVTDLGKVLLWATGVTEGFDKAVQDAALHVASFELDIASFFLRFTNAIPIVGDFVDIVRGTATALDAAGDSTRLTTEQVDTLSTAIQSGDPTYLAFRDHWVGIFDTFLGGTGKVEAANAAIDNGTQIVQNFLGVLPGFDALFGGVGDAAQDAGEDVRRFAHMTGKELKDWKTGVEESIDSYILDLDNLSTHTEQTRREFIEAHHAMLVRARETNRALIEIRNEDWVNPNYIKFLADQGPEALINFAGLNDEKQHNMQQAWKETTRLTDASGDSLNAITRTLDNLDSGHTKHEVEIHYTYSGFDPSKPGMSGSAQQRP